ncbi:hypothetical protein ACFQFC_12940 [Amorphoplanes digitatis]|uniref:Uncharacterized protein n=1 Tax=Actinoplanes digitatis TaxID=1868 RepID=A0A7W7MT04_9ACTN|nr:hypothetical protein [Actinoplanes digitatis]MBB4765109.1 hypothetical protein [Actinoplanes digitatis]
MIRVGEIDRAVGLGEPHLHAVALQRFDDPAGLATGERPLELAHHHRIKPAIRIL